VVYSAISTATITDIQNKSNLANNEANLITALNALRIAFPNAMITTYTYKPSIGLSTVTDPKGDTMNFIYDDFNRLKEVRDKNNNILSENEYRYKTQN
jgi:YD repeat-containing protein